MTARRINPVIYAGLTGLVTLTKVTQPALALPSAQSAGQTTGGPSAGAVFVAGCFVGALVATGATYVMMRRAMQAIQVELNTLTSSIQTDDKRGNTALHGIGGVVAHPYEAPKPYQPNSIYAVAVNNYDEIAEDYVRKLTLADRMASRAKGVAQVLTERLGSSRMEEMPHIKRASSSFGSSEEPWWDESLVVQTPSTTPTTTPKGNVDLNSYTHVQSELESMHHVGANYAVQPHRSISKASVRRKPTRELLLNLPYVCSADEAEQKNKMVARSQRWSDQQQDLWAIALTAMEENFKEQVVLGADATDPAYAATTYGIDKENSLIFDMSDFYLSDDEMDDKNSSRRHLRLIDGGTGECAPRHLAAQAQ